MPLFPQSGALMGVPRALELAISGRIVVPSGKRERAFSEGLARLSKNMIRAVRYPRLLPRDHQGWAVLGSRALVLLGLEGAIVLVALALMGPNASYETLPLGFQVNHPHAVLHLASGVAGALFGFVWTTAAVSFTRVFAVFYVLLAIFGSFTPYHFGLDLKLGENLFHWTVGLSCAAVAFGFPLFAQKAASAQKS